MLQIEVARARPLWLTIALLQGIVAPCLFLVIVVVGGVLTPGYNHVSQAVSELTEAGAPNKELLDPLLLLIEGLTAVFGLGFLCAVHRSNQWLKASAVLMILIGLAGMLFYRYPMDPVGVAMTSAGRLHLMLVSASAVAALLSVFMSFRDQSASMNVVRLFIDGSRP